MNAITLSLRNVGRNRFRTVGTVCGVAAALVAFVLLQTVLSSWQAGAKYAAQDRIGTRHKVTFVMTLPRKYAAEVERTPGVVTSMHANWFGGKDPNHESEFFATIAVQTASFFRVYDEISVPPAQKQAWLETRNGAIVGDVLAKKLNWHVGDKVTLRGTIFPGDFQFVISGIYSSARRTIDRSTFWFHYDYMNEALPPRQRDQIGWIMSRIDDPSAVARVSRAIDAKFADSGVQTLSMSERALNTSFLGMMSAILKAVSVASGGILIVMMLILGNTIAMGVRERTREYGVLRAVGFGPGQVVRWVLGEATLVSLAGTALGIAVACALTKFGLAPFIEQNLGGLFPYFRVEASTVAAALGVGLTLGLLAAGLPAYRASKVDVSVALRKVA